MNYRIMKSSFPKKIQLTEGSRSFKLGCFQAYYKGISLILDKIFRFLRKNGCRKILNN